MFGRGKLVFERINADESLQMLVYVCLPLLLLLVVGLVIRLLRRPRLAVNFPDFKLTISQVGQEDAFVTYSSGGNQTAFEASLGRGSYFGHRRISVHIPREMDLERAKTVVRDLALGLAELRYEYVIFRKREPRQVTQEERDAAVDQLRQMGFDLERSVAQQGQVTRLVTLNGLPARGGKLSMNFSGIQKLVSQAQGIEERVEVLDSGIPGEKR